MLIDLETDPGEMVNLAKERRHEPRLREGRRLLRAWHERNGVALDQGYLAG